MSDLILCITKQITAMILNGAREIVLKFYVADNLTSYDAAIGKIDTPYVHSFPGTMLLDILEHSLVLVANRTNNVIIGIKVLEDEIKVTFPIPENNIYDIDFLKEHYKMKLEGVRHGIVYIPMNKMEVKNA